MTIEEAFDIMSKPLFFGNQEQIEARNIIKAWAHLHKIKLENFETMEELKGLLCPK